MTWSIIFRRVGSSRSSGAGSACRIPCRSLFSWIEVSWRSDAAVTRIRRQSCNGVRSIALSHLTHGVINKVRWEDLAMLPNWSNRLLRLPPVWSHAGRLGCCPSLAPYSEVARSERWVIVARGWVRETGIQIQKSLIPSCVSKGTVVSECQVKDLTGIGGRCRGLSRA